MLRIPGVIGLLQSGASDGPSFVAPMIISESTSAKSAGDGKWTLHGNLTLRGQTKPVTVQVTLKGSRYSGEAIVKQTDFGIKPPGKAGVRAKDEVHIEFQVQLAH